MTQRPRVLLAITVYNGRGVVERTLDSAVELDRHDADVDVLVLDDASPAPGFSREVEARCRRHGLGYYRSPRNLGIVRNVNLGLAWAVHHGYDHVIIANSDVIFPERLVPLMLSALSSAPGAGAIQAWSNNVSAFSMPNADPDRHLSNQEFVNRFGAVLEAEFGSESVALPCGVSFCLLIPTEVVRHVGLMDPVFGRGYCEETDWTLRARGLDYDVVLAPAAFVYHSGGGSTIAAGLLAPGETTVGANEAVIDHRYPGFRADVATFMDGPSLPELIDRARLALLRSAATRSGYDLDISWLERTAAPERLRALINPGREAAHVSLSYLGFDQWYRFTDGDGPAAVRRALGRDPDRVTIIDHGEQAERARVAFPDVLVEDGLGYPTRI
jgi:GT2 family glycosyltransferase